MRPRGEIRQALSEAALEAPDHGVTWRELAGLANVGYAAARMTVEAMARAGELVVIGEVRVEHSRRPMNRYQVAKDADEVTRRSADLTNTINTWATFV